MARITEDWEGQHIESIPLEKLVLWSENPRDPIDPDADNEQIIENALNGKGADSKWELDKFAKEMGDKYDFSSLPTVAAIEGTDKYTVYDGNRRVIIAMMGAWGAPSMRLRTTLPLFPEEIPCCVCSRDDALKSVYRRHSENGSWGQYERDVFIYRYMNAPKSVLVRLEDLIHAVTRWPKINLRYVEEDILNDKHLKEFGLKPGEEDFGVPPETLEELIKAIADGIEDGSLNTRGNRNDPTKALSDDLLKRVYDDAARHKASAAQGNKVDERDTDGLSGNVEKGIKGAGQGGLFDDGRTDGGQLEKGSDDGDSERDPVDDGTGDSSAGETVSVNTAGSRRTRTTKEKGYSVFNGKLILRAGSVNNLYRTLECLWKMNEAGKIEFNAGFNGVIRMGLRLLAETAAKEDQPNLRRKQLKAYVSTYADSAKKAIRLSGMDNDLVTFLSGQSVTAGSIENLLQTGAHSYTLSSGREQALAVSIFLAEMLKLSHGK